MSATWLPSEPLYIPLYACCASLAALFLGTVAHLLALNTSSSDHTAHRQAERGGVEVQLPDHRRESRLSKARIHVYARGGPTVYAFHVLKLLGCAALVALSIVAVLLSKSSITEGKIRRPSRDAGPQMAVTIAYIYAAVMSLFALTVPSVYRRTCDSHATFVLLVQFGVFSWRNLYPLTMFGGLPADSSVPWLLWCTGVVVTIVGVLIPLLIPRVYYPADPTDPASTSSPEQTASVLSFVLFSFLDPFVFTAYRTPNLPYEGLPPLPDYDLAKHLAARSLDKLDPLRRQQNGLKDRHLFFSLLQIFAWENFAAAAAVAFHAVVRFIGPIAVNQLLVYLETGGRGAVYQPWVWVILLLCGSVLNSVVMNLYFFITSHVIVQVENIIIQLVFERLLKVRTVDASPTPPSSTTVVAHRDQDVSLGEDTLAESNMDATLSASLPSTETSSTASSTTAKGKHKQATDQTAANDEPRKSEVIGRVNTIIGTDLPNIVNGRDWLLAIEIPLGISLSVWYLYTMLGVSAFVGMAFTILGLPIPGMVTRLLRKVQKERMQRTEARVQFVSEAMSMLRVAKMFGWEAKLNKDIAEKRDAELAYVRTTKVLNMVNNNVVFIIPLVTMIVTFTFYTLVLKKELDASRVFPSIVVFDLLRSDLTNAFMWISGIIIQGGISLTRVNEFLSSTELLDQYDRRPVDQSMPPREDNAIGFHQATFTWMSDTLGPPRLGQRDFRLHIDDLLFKENVINLIVGPTGCGKTSILLALLGEMRFHASNAASWFNLPRARGISYAAQEPWVQSETIKSNILFDEPYDAERYHKVLYQCALEPDLSLFEAGDETEVGEKGLTLSGGQKARVTLARAVYSRAQIILLDDVLSALDVHTARWIVDKCFRGDLLVGRTVLLVTHNVAIAAPVSGNVISLGLNGRVTAQGSVADVLSIDPLFRMELTDSAAAVEAIEKAEVVEAKPQAEKADGKLVLAEQLAEGRLSRRSAEMFLGGFGGPLFWIVCLSGYVLVHMASVTSTWWLGVWASAYEGEAITVDVPYYLIIYALIMNARTVIYAFSYIFYTFASLESCRKIHERLAQSVLRSTLRWLDTTPTGRIISRFTQDIREVDVIIPFELEDIIMKTASMLMGFVAIVVISPIFALPGLVLVVIGSMVGQIYIVAELAVKRQHSNWRSPLYNHFSAAAAGVASIRAFGAEQLFRSELQLRLDGYSRPTRILYNLNSWISIRMDLIGGIFTASLAAYLLYFNNGVGASNTGFSLNMAVAFSELIIWWVRTLNEIEIAANSLERIIDYIDIEHEPPPTEEGKPPAYWPSSGSIRVENLSARYSNDGPTVLNDLSFDIKSGERVAIVGRTGSGKSSLALSLLRMIPTTGVVYFDGRPTHEINLDILRTNLTIIPQDPILISGTLRANLDPLTQFDDVTLNDALRAAGLFSLERDDDENRITLDTHISSGGNNFSVGQRQIIALARAIVRGAKVLILDEATASVDAETDNIIQASIREQLKHSTLITIAHRLQTVADYDKILVLDGGRMAEFDTPIALLEKGGLFHDLVQQSGDRDKLWEMARKSKSPPLAR